jgi:ATP/maltotriose-dependent transcriptional regulator MalT
MAESYAPSTLATIAMSEGDFDRANEMIEQSLNVAQANDWHRLIAWDLALRGILAFYRWLEEGGDQIHYAINTLKSSEDGWRLLDEAGEFYASLAIATYVQDGPDQAKAVLKRAHAAVDESWTAARILLELAETVIDGNPLDEIIQLFRQKGFERGAVFAEKIELVLGKQFGDG